MKRLLLLAILLILVGFGAYLYLDQRVHDVSGSITDTETKQPIPGAQVQAGSQTTSSDAFGRFSLRGLLKGTTITASAAGYLPQGNVAVNGSLLDTSWPANLTLRPNTLEGTVTAAGGSSLAGATVTVNAQTVTADAQGRFTFRRVPPGSQVAAVADGFLPAVAVFQEGQALNLTLEPNTLSGSVLDGATNLALAGVTVGVSGQVTTTDSAGRYTFRGIPRGSPVTLQADGYLSATYAFAVGEDQRVTLTPNTLSGLVTDAETGSPLPGVTVQEGSHTIQADAGGHFTLTRVLLAAVLQVTADGYLPGQFPVQGKPALTVSLQPNQVQGMVRDTLTGRPVVSATVYLDGRSTRTDAEGHYLFRRVKRGQSIVVTAEGYAPAGVVVGTPLASPLPGGTEGVILPGGMQGGVILDIGLRPGRVSGTVRDAVTGAPIAGATVSIDGLFVTTAADGSYSFGVLPVAAALTAKYPGYRLARLVMGAASGPDIALQPFTAKGLYMPYGLALGQPEAARALLEAGAKAGLNTVVIDVKSDIRDDVGRLAYQSQNKLAQRIGASRASSTELLALLKFAKEKGLYTIARIMVFKDDLLARGAPEMAIKNKRTNGPWMDSGGSLWVDPYNAQVWAYNLALAKESAALGFDEVQFDYIRLPSDGAVGDIVYPAKAADDDRKRWQMVESLLAQIPRELPNVYVSVDTFGWTAWKEGENDLGIGQRLVEMARYVDYVSPMIYPSTFDAGSLDYDKPSEHPYEVVYRSSVNAAARIAHLRCKIRPWLQDFNDYSYGLPYGAPQVAAQIKAAEDAKAYGWLLWNPAGAYTQEAWKRSGVPI